MAYVALYRRWRPQDFEGLIGQTAVKTALINALDSGKTAHAYLFTGPRGTGKTSTARILARALNCEKGPTSKPCGECESCRRIAAGTSLDVLEIDAASNRGIEEIKNLREQLAFVPAESRYKIYIIDEVHMLTKEAFNAFLKTLEEPPRHVIFILATTDPHKIPPTIHSRCQRFDFRRVTVDAITEHLAHVAAASGIKADTEALKLIAINADGGVRDALTLLDQCSVVSSGITTATVREILGIADDEAMRGLVTAIGSHDVTAALELLWHLLAQGKNEKQLLVDLAEYYRAMLLYKVAPSFEEIYLTDSKENLAKLAALFSEERIMAAQERLHQGSDALKTSLRQRITLELCLIDLCREEGSTLAALAARIDALEKRLEAQSVPTFAFKNTAGPVAKAPRDPRQKNTATSSAVAPAATDPRMQVPPSEKKQVPLDLTKNTTATRGSTTPNLNSGKEKAPARPAQVFVPASGTEDKARLEALWQKTLELMKTDGKNMMVSLVKDTTRIYDFANGVLRIAFQQEFASTRFNKQDYNSAFKAYFQKVSRLALTSLVGLGPDEIAQIAATAPAEQSAGSPAVVATTLANDAQASVAPKATVPDIKGAKAFPAYATYTQVETAKPRALNAAAVPAVLLKAQKILGGTIERVPSGEKLEAEPASAAISGDR